MWLYRDTTRNNGERFQLHTGLMLPQPCCPVLLDRVPAHQALGSQPASLCASPPPFHSFFYFRLCKIFPLASLSRQYLLFGTVHPGFLLAMTDVSLIIPLPCHPSLLSLQLIIAPPLSVHFKQASLKLATPLTLSEKSLSPSNPRSAQNDSSLEAWGVLFLFRNE